MRPLVFVILAASMAGTPTVGQTRSVAITVDDLPTVSAGPEHNADELTTNGILAALRQHRAPAIGFVNEGKLYRDGVLQRDRVRLIGRWLNEGHDVGNHTYTHRKLYDTPTAQYLRDILDGERITREMTERVGKELRYFRHPFLNTGRSLEQRDSVNAFLSAHGYAVAPVTLDNYDYEFARAYERALAEVDSVRLQRVGETYVKYMTDVFEFYERQSMAILGYEVPQILLLHANRLNADWLAALLSRIKQRDYDFITLDAALQDEAYQLSDTVVTQYGYSWLHRWAITAGMDRSIFRGEPDVPAWIRSRRDD